jgi:hypothetical protein
MTRIIHAGLSSPSCACTALNRQAVLRVSPGSGILAIPREPAGSHPAVLEVCTLLPSLCKESCDVHILSGVARRDCQQTWCVSYVNESFFTGEAYTMRASYHSVLQTMSNPKRPWRHLEWIRSVDYYRAGLDITQVAEA